MRVERNLFTSEGLQLMKTGGQYLFEIPPELGYGGRGSPPRIGPNATLFFLVELVSIEQEPEDDRRPPK